MILYKISRTEKTPGFSESIFIETLGGIFTEAPCIGFFKHPTITTHEALKAHLDQLKKEGFKISSSTHTCKV